MKSYNYRTINPEYLMEDIGVLTAVKLLKHVSKRNKNLDVYRRFWVHLFSEEHWNYNYLQGYYWWHPTAVAPHSSSCLENPMDGGAWKAAVHGVADCRTWLSDFTFTFHFHALEKEMATHSSVLAWRIPGMGEPGGLPSLGSHRVRHDWSDSSSNWWESPAYARKVLQLNI